MQRGRGGRNPSPPAERCKHSFNDDRPGTAWRADWRVNVGRMGVGVLVQETCEKCARVRRFFEGLGLSAFDRTRGKL